MSEQAITWFKKIFEDKALQNRHAATLGGRHGLQTIHENLLNCDFDGFKEDVMKRLGGKGTTGNSVKNFTRQLKPLPLNRVPPPPKSMPAAPGHNSPDKSSPSPDLFQYLQTPTFRLPVSEGAYSKISDEEGFEEADSYFKRASSFIESGADPGPIDEDDALFAATELFRRFLGEMNESLAGSSVFLGYKSKGNKSQKYAIDPSGTARKKDRPDITGFANGSSMLVVEVKGTDLFKEGEDQLKRYLGAGFNKAFFGGVPYLLGFLLVGHILRVAAVSPEGEVTYMSQNFDLSYPVYRARALVITVNAYRLWVTISGLLPDLAWRRSLFVPLERPNGCMITFLSSSVLKTIKNFPAWMDHFNSSGSLESIQKAYACGEECSNVANLVDSSEQPSISTRGLYRVKIRPYGPQAEPTTLEGLQIYTTGVLRALRSLHAAELVFKDLRGPNVLCRDGAQNGEVVLIDMEYAGEADSEWHHEHLADWTQTTLNEGVYGKMSDLHQLGVLLENRDLYMGLLRKPVLLRKFIEELKQKSLTADQALQHSWLSVKC